MVEGSLEVKLPTIWRDEKAVSREKSQKRKDQKKEDAGARKGRKVAKHCVFSWFCGSGGLKSRLAKAAGAETSGEMRDEKLHAVVARSRFRSEKVQNIAASDHFWKFRCWKSARRCGAKHICKSKCKKHWGVRTTFGSWDVEKVRGVVARSTFRSQNVQSTPWSDHFWKLRCRKSARRRGAKHICEVKMYKTHYGTDQVKMYKKPGVRTTFGGSDVVSRGRCTRLWILSKVRKTWGFCGISTKDGRHGTFADDLRWSAKTHFPWQAQDKRHVHERGWEIRALISWERLHCGVSEM